MAKKTTLSISKIMTALAYIARGASANEAAQKFNINKNTMNGIVSGRARSEETGILPEKGKNGVEYIRANKDMFIKKTDEKTSTTKAPAAKKPAITSTTKPETKTNTPVVAGSLVDLSSNVSAIREQATTAITTIDAEIEKHKSSLEALYSQRKNWEEMSTSFASM